MTTNPYLIMLGRSLFYLAGDDAIVFPEHKQAGGWRCTVVAQRRPVPGVRHLDVANDQLAAAPTFVVANPRDPDGCAMLWLARVWREWSGGPVWLGASTLTYDIRKQGTLHVHIDGPARRRLLEVTRLMVPGVQRLLDQLSRKELLLPELPAVDGGMGSYYLNIIPALLVHTHRRLGP